MTVAGQGSAASLVTGRLNAASIITTDLSLRGAQTSITLENSNGPTITLSALTGGGFQIQQNTGTGGGQSWTPVITIRGSTTPLALPLPATPERRQLPPCL